LHGSGLIRLPVVRHVVGQRVVRVGRRQQCLNAEQHGANLQRGRPLVLEDVEADAAQLVDVGVVNARQEAHLGRRHGVVGRQEQLQLEDAIWSTTAPVSISPSVTSLHLNVLS